MRFSRVFDERRVENRVIFLNPRKYFLSALEKKYNYFIIMFGKKDLYQSYRLSKDLPLIKNPSI